MSNQDWLADALRDAGCKVVELAGWKTRGRLGVFGPVKGILCHHTAGSKTGNAPSLPLIVSGRPDLPGPLSQIHLARDGTFTVIAAGRCNHAGTGAWQGVTSGNSSFIGIEAENAGDGTDPWPDVQMESYARGCAAILKHIGASVIMCAGHKEYATPKGRKIDPSFSMPAFRAKVEAFMDGGVAPFAPPTLRKGDKGENVRKLQRKLSLTPDGIFGSKTEKAVKDFQVEKGLAADGIAGPATWAVL